MDSDKIAKARLYERIHSQFVWRFPKAAKIIGHLVSSGQLSAEQFIDFVLFYFDETERIEQNRELLSPSFDVTQVQAVVKVILRDGQLSRGEWYSFLIALYQFLGEAEQRELVRSATRQTPLLERYAGTRSYQTIWDRRKKAFCDFVLERDLEEAKNRFGAEMRKSGFINTGIGLDDTFLKLLIRKMEDMEIFEAELSPRWLRFRFLSLAIEDPYRDEPSGVVVDGRELTIREKDFMEWLAERGVEDDLVVLKKMGFKTNDPDDPTRAEAFKAFIVKLYVLFSKKT